MKKSVSLFISVMLLSLMACQRESNPIIDNQPECKLIPKTFHVSVVETRTYLDENGKSIKWSEGDLINVIGVTADGIVSQHSFSLKEGDGGKSSGSFEGTVNEEETTFYAIYPNYSIDESKIEAGDDCVVLISENLPVSNDIMQQKGYVNGYDADFGILVAKCDEMGNLAFQHVMSFFKFKMGVDNVSKVKMSTSGDLRFGARVQYKPSTGAIEVQSAKKAVEITPATGSTFVKDATYLVAFPPRTDKKIKQFTLEYTSVDGFTQSLDVNDANFKNLVCEPGKIYNLGCPPISFDPVISYEALSKLEYDATSGSFTYSISNVPEGAEASAEITSGTWISNVTVTGNTVSFDCEKNDAADAEERTAVITLSFEGAENVNVTITQKAQDFVPEVYDWNFTGWDMASITDAESGKDIPASFTYEGLTFIPKSSGSKWGTISGQTYIQTGGKNTKTSPEAIDADGKVFKFTTSSKGTVTITASNTGSSNSARKITVKVDDKEPIVQSGDGVTGTTPVSVTIENVPAGTIRVFSQDESVRIFRIQFSNL